jgi:hypothetical protein
MPLIPRCLLAVVCYGFVLLGGWIPITLALLDPHTWLALDYHSNITDYPPTR